MVRHLVDQIRAIFDKFLPADFFVTTIPEPGYQSIVIQSTSLTEAFAVEYLAPAIVRDFSQIFS